jgi:carbon monoxide dehydrogenase subunit G
VKIDQEFRVGVPVQRAWEVLTDLERVAPCLPGAQLTGVDDGVYAGKVRIKVGPVVSDYAGTARFVEKDDAAYRGVIEAKGKDSRGSGNASATISAQLRADGAQTVVTVSTDLSITGKIAQFGSGIIKEVSEKLLGQFVQNLETTLLVPVATPTTAPTTTTATTTATATASGAGEAAPAAVTPGPAPADPVADPVAQTAPLDLMSLAGGSVYKRLVPLLVVLVVVVAAVVYVVGT